MFASLPEIHKGFSWRWQEVYIQPQVLSQIMLKHCGEIIIHNKPVSNPLILACKTGLIRVLPYEEIHGITLGLNVFGRRMKKNPKKTKKTLLLYQYGWHGNLCCPHLEVELGEEWLGLSTKCVKKQKWMQPLCCDSLFFEMQQKVRRNSYSLIKKVFGNTANRVLSFSSLVFLVLIILPLTPSQCYAIC